MFGGRKRSFFGSAPTALATRAVAAPRPLLIARKVRQVGDNWFGAASFLGGLPKLGPTPWPRDANGKPLHFMAQLDLAEVDRASGGRSVLPKHGALAFFLGGPERGKILHLPEPGTTFTPAPEGRAPLETIGGGGLIDPALSHGPAEFPFWAAVFQPLAPSIPQRRDDAESYDAAREAQYADIARSLETRQYNFSLKVACETAGLAEVPLYWLAAIMFAERVPRMLDAVAQARVRGVGYVETSSARLTALNAGLPPPKGQGRWGNPATEKINAENWIETGRKAIAHADAHEAEVDDYVARVKAAMPDIDPYRRVTPNDAAKLDALFGEGGKAPLKDYAQYRLPHSWRSFGGDAVRLMACGSDEALSRLPKALRDVIFQSYRLPAGSAHLMFGLGENIQGNPKIEALDDQMVLQLTYDDLLDWSFGDNGVYQFWMPVAALQSGDFSKAEVTFECH